MACSVTVMLPNLPSHMGSCVSKIVRISQWCFWGLGVVCRPHLLPFNLDPCGIGAGPRDACFSTMGPCRISGAYETWKVDCY